MFGDVQRMKAYGKYCAYESQEKGGCTYAVQRSHKKTGELIGGELFFPDMGAMFDWCNEDDIKYKNGLNNMQKKEKTDVQEQV